jgi:RNA polymerase sigma-70 factor (ECF subfamily)
MKRAMRRSGGVNETLAVAIPAQDVAGELDFDALYRSSRDDVFAYVAGILRDRSAAEDVVAAAFERAYRKRRSWDRRRGEPRAWLFGIARNAALDELRRRKWSAPSDVEPPDIGSPGADEAVEGALRFATVRAAIGTLNARDREIVALKFFAGLSYAEIACVLGVTESNAGTLLHRAVQKLRKACDATD